MSSGKPPQPEEHEGVDKAVYAIAFAALAAGAAVYGAFILIQWWIGGTLISEHFTALVGLPAAFGAAFVVVALFRTVEGRIVFSALGFKFEGASGPIVMWVLCFLAIVAAIKALW